MSRNPATVPRSRDALGLFAFLALSFGVLVLGARAVSPGLVEWYPRLHKPAWTPPSWVFGPVWALVYPAMAVAGWRAWREGRGRRGQLLYLVQLALNAAWPWLFFSQHRLDLAMADAVLLVVAAAATIVAFWGVHRGAALLLVPYLGWLGFAAALAHEVWRLNPQG